MHLVIRFSDLLASWLGPLASSDANRITASQSTGSTIASQNPGSLFESTRDHGG